MDQRIKLIIACEAFKGELKAFDNEITVPILWLAQAMHNVPNQLHAKLQEKITEAEEILSPGDTVLLFLGNCGGALKGIYSKTLHLSYPAVEDCIPVILGSMEKFKSLQAVRPGSFYLNKNWIDAAEDPLNAAKKYIANYGEKKGWKIAKLMYKNYTHFVLINNGCYELEEYRKHVQESCKKFEKAYLEQQGDLKYIEAILNRTCPMVDIEPNPQGISVEEYKSRAAFFPGEDA